MNGDESQAISRRSLVRMAVGATAAAGTTATAGTGGAQEGTSTTVDMTDGLTFEPAEVTVAPGDTVVWENVGSIGHTVTAYEDDIPEGAEYWASGGFDSESAARGGYPPDGEIGGGGTYEHTFETTGEHAYFCIPHESAGMTGTVVVQEGGGGGDGGGSDIPTLPDSAMTVMIAILGAMGSTLAVAYFFLKYGGRRPSNP